MTWRVSDKEFEAVSTLPASARYAHFVKRVADTEEVWSLWSAGGWVLMGDDAGREIVPVWPHERYAAACASGEWAGHQPRAVALAEWMECWLPGMARDGRLVAVFPTGDDRGPVVAPERLRSDLADALLEYE